MQLPYSALPWLCVQKLFHHKKEMAGVAHFSEKRKEGRDLYLSPFSFISNILAILLFPIFTDGNHPQITKNRYFIVKIPKSIFRPPR
jgi:hypothetical protein